MLLPLLPQELASVVTGTLESISLEEEEEGEGGEGWTGKEKEGEEAAAAAAGSTGHKAGGGMEDRRLLGTVNKLHK